MGADFKLNDAIDESIFKKLKMIGEEADKTANSYAKLCQELAKQVNINPGNLDALQQKAEKGNEALKRIAQTEKELSRLQAEQKKAYADMAKELEKQVKIATAKAKLDAAEITRERQKIKLENEKQKQARKTAATEKEISSALNTQAKTLSEAAKQNSILRQAVKNVDITMDDAIETINRYNAKIEENEALQDKFADGMSKRRRNIGNYASAFDGLGMSVQQVARELPALSMGINTFVLAISNNLPVLVDEINRAREANVKLRKEGQQTTPVWKQVASSIISWQTALVVGITLLSAYGKDVMEWAGNLFKGKDAAKGYKEALEDVNEALAENSGNYGDTVTKLKTLQDTWNSLGDDLQSKMNLIEDNQSLFDELGISVGDVNDAEKVFVENTPVLIEALGLKARAAASYNLAVEQETLALKKQMEAEKLMATTNIWDYWNAGIDVLTNFDAVLQGIDMWNPEIYSKARAGGLLLEADAATEAAAAYDKLYLDLQNQAKNLLSSSGFKISDNVNEETDSALLAYQEYINDIKEQSEQLDIDLMEDSHERNVAAIKKEYKDRMDAITGNTEAEIELRRKLNEMQEKALAEEDERYINEKKAKQKTKTEDEIRAVNDAARLQIQALKNGLKEQENELLKSHKGTEADEKKHKENMLRITFETNKKILEAQLAAAEKELEIATASGAIPETKLAELREKIRSIKAEIERMDLDWNLKLDSPADENEKKIENLAKSLTRITEITRGVSRGFGDIFDAASSFAVDMAKGFDEMWKELDNDEKFEYIEQKFAQVASGITSLMSDMYASRIENVEEEQRELDEAKDKEIERIERLADFGAISEEEAEARKRAAEDKTAKKQEELEKKKAALQMKQARWDKANSIAQAAIATALGVVKSLPNFVLAGIVAAFGAAQMAIIAATPLPKYKHGTNYHKGGLAIVGDGGVAETILTDKGAYLTPSIPTLVDIPRGAKVLPYAVDVDRMKSKVSDLDALIAFRKENELPPINISTDNSGVEKRLEKLEASQKKVTKELIKAIKYQDFKSFAAKI